MSPLQAVPTIGRCHVYQFDLADAVQRAKDGDEQGFAVLWRSLQPAVLRYARILVGSAADDVAAEAWFQVARDLPAFRGSSDQFRGWLFTIVRNRATDERRRSRRRREDPVGLAVLPDRVAPASDEEALNRIATERALELIASLPRDQAEAVALRVVAGLDSGQAAAVLGKRPGAVRVAAMRGLRRLAERMATEAEDPAAGGEHGLPTPGRRERPPTPRRVTRRDVSSPPTRV